MFCDFGFLLFTRRKYIAQWIKIHEKQKYLQDNSITVYRISRSQPGPSRDCLGRGALRQDSLCTRLASPLA
jgi:hypothetical protein